jgi:putative restriction endonuclease
MWSECLERAVARTDIEAEWALDALDAKRAGKPVLITPRLGQSSFRLAVLDAYGQQCAVTTEHSLPVIDAAHIRPWAVGGTHSIPNGVPLRRDLQRLLDLGYVTIRPNLQFAVSRRLRDDYANGRVYYELNGRKIRLPESDAVRPDSAARRGTKARSFSDGEVGRQPERSRQSAATPARLGSPAIGGQERAVDTSRNAAPPVRPRLGHG